MLGGKGRGGKGCEGDERGGGWRLGMVEWWNEALKNDSVQAVRGNRVNA